MTFLAVILLIVYFSCNVNSELDEFPKFPVPKFDNGDVEWTVTPRIVGGYSAFEGEFPAKISIQQTGYPNRVTHFCGGALINLIHVLTAAHCVTTAEGALRPPSFFLLVGDLLDLTTTLPHRQSKTATHVFVHPRYNTEYILNDIAIIRANSQFVVTSTFSPLGRIQVTPNPGVSCSVAGWGATVYEGPISPRLQRINAAIISRAQCNGRDSYNGFVRDGMICAGTMAGGVDTCQGDSGGALICGNEITGIVSWGIECALPMLPGVYTEVAAFNPWIDEMLLWDGTHASIPTPTTVRSGSTFMSISITLIAACLSVALASR